MSTMVTRVHYMPEKLHKDFQSNIFSDIDYSLHAASAGLGASDNFSPMNSDSLSGVWSIQRPENVPRRNSTSSLSSISNTRNRMNMNSLTSMANVIPETSTATISTTMGSMSAMGERFRERAYSEGASSMSSLDSMQPQQQPIASSRYKTELCRPYEENGKCKYGDKCQFAHGKHELRQLVRHPKYKTELCRTFHTSGFCPYGPRCHFIHNQEDNPNRPSMYGASNSAANMNHQPMNNGFGAMGHGTPVAVPTPHISERNHYNHRPAQLNLLAKQLSASSSFGNLPVPGPLGGSPPYYQSDMGCSALMSPTSPNSTSSGGIFNFSNLPPVNAERLANVMSSAQYDTFDMLLSQGSQFETTVNDDNAFEGPPTPPDSDRESMTGSPPEKQRLPIFRCLSQS